MRAVQQLIIYLDNRGLLSVAQLDYLRRNAFLPGHEAQTERVLAAKEAIQDRVDQRAGDGIQASLDIQEDMEREHLRQERSRARQRGRRSMGRSRLIKHAPLVRHRPAAYETNDFVDSSVIARIARKLEPQASAKTAEQIIRTASPPRLAQALDEAAQRELNPSDRRNAPRNRKP